MRTGPGQLLLIAFAACLSTAASAQVFKCTQSSGLVTYSDKPCHIVSRAPVMDRQTDAPDKPAFREAFSKEAVLRRTSKEPAPKEVSAKEVSAKEVSAKEVSAKEVSAKDPAPKQAESDRVMTASADTEASEKRSAAPDAPTAESLQLRALGPNQALDRQGRVYSRVPNGYLDANGVFYTGLASGHR